MSDSHDGTFQLPPGHDPSKPGPGALKKEADVKQLRERRHAARLGKTPLYHELGKQHAQHARERHHENYRAENYDAFLADALAVKQRIAELEASYPADAEAAGKNAEELHFLRLEWAELRHECMQAANVLRGRGTNTPEQRSKIAEDMRQIGA